MEKIVLPFSGNHNVAVEEPGEVQPRYYVYGKNGIEGIYANPGKAVALAYSAAGVVVDDDTTFPMVLTPTLACSVLII